MQLAQGREGGREGAGEDEFLQSLTQMHDGRTGQYAIWSNGTMLTQPRNDCIFISLSPANQDYLSNLSLNRREGLLIDRNLRIPPAPTLDRLSRQATPWGHLALLTAVCQATSFCS